MKPTNILSKAVLTLGIALFLGACGNVENSRANLDQGSVTVKVYAPLTGDCASSIQARLKPSDLNHDSSGGGGGRSGLVTDSSCSGYVLEISGKATESDSVLISLGSNDFVAQVKDGSFTFLVNVSNLDLPLTLAGMDSNGVLGVALTFDASRIELVSSL